MKRFLLCLTALLFLLPAAAFSEESRDPELALGGNLFLINREHPIGKDYYPHDLMEPKVQAAVAVAKGGLVGPVKGSSGVYMVQVDSKTPNANASADAVKAQLEQGFRNKARFLTQALRMSADITDQRNKFF